MNSEDALGLIKYAMMVYPSLRLTDNQIANAVNVWAAEFADESQETVRQAFKLARQESPDWMPSIPKIQAAIVTLKSVLRKKSKEQEFRDAHCGKSEDEWNECLNWEQSDDGKQKINAFKSQLKALAGENNE